MNLQVWQHIGSNGGGNIAAAAAAARQGQRRRQYGGSGGGSSKFPIRATTKQQPTDTKKGTWDQIPFIRIISYNGIVYIH